MVIDGEYIVKISRGITYLGIWQCTLYRYRYRLHCFMNHDVIGYLVRLIFLLYA